ncbi:MAG TPA: LysR family transcriptional regulator [Candidatus Udaeobacter sp.]|nr:LysR family transcriptional regulator [Candidatus Udaeobacter sp.]
MNIHHLELVYFVAKHGGIAAAVRNIPYGIQQPAVSGQIAKLEESLGTKLFQRRPFALSPAGVELFEFIKPFFDNIEIVGAKLRQKRSPQLRIAAPSIVLYDYIPELLQKLRSKFPEFRLYLHEAARAEAERLLLAREVDLAITLVEKKSRAGIQVQPLLELPLILLVHRNSGLARAGELWKRDKIEETLISFPRTDPIHASFQRGLERLGVEWFCGIEVNSSSLDRALRRERLWNRFGSGCPRLQARCRRARFGIAEFSPGCCRSLVVRQAIEYFKTTPRRARN